MLDVPHDPVGLFRDPRSALSPRSQQSLFTLPAFRGLGEVELQRVAALFAEIGLAKGETIYEAGDDAHALYLVVSGAVDVMDGAEVVAPTRDDARLPNSFDVVVRILQIMQHELGNDRAGEADVLVKPDLRAFWVLEFWKAAAIIEEGRRAAETALPSIREKLASLHVEGP